MDKSWLHRLIGMYAKWAKKLKFQHVDYEKTSHKFILRAKFLFKTLKELIDNVAFMDMHWLL